MYGTSIKKQLMVVGYDISSGSLYPMLHALETERLLESRTEIVKGRTRRYYVLTAEGRACLEWLRGKLGGLVRDVFFCAGT
jgi:DNA-binding PadR family transcriptional regulator